MAVGDLIGDLATAYLTPAQRAAKNGVQSITGGPIARATDQLPKVAGLAAAAPVAAGQPGTSQPQSLASAFVDPSQFGAPAPVTAPQSLASLSPPATPAFGATSTQVQQPASLADALPSTPTQTPAATQPQQPVGLDSAYRSTGVGTGTNAIVGRVGANGVPQFSNQPADLASASGSAPVSNGPQMPTSLADLAPGGRSADSNAPLSTLGSASNLGDGIGTFSQGQAGDSQLALTRFQRANDLRNAYQAQDSADLASARANQGAQLGIVRDSSQRLTRSDLAANQLDQQAQANLVQNASRARQSLEDLRTGQNAATQTRQAQRLEDAFTAATAPNATAEQKQRYQMLVDPTGASSLKTQQAQAQLANTQVEGQLKQQQLAQNTVSQQQAAQDRNRGQAGQVATIDQALSSVDSLLGTRVDPKNPNGKRLDEDPGLEGAVGLSSIFPTVPGSKSADFEARLDTLKAQSFLPQVALLKGAGALSDAEGKKLSDSIGALSPKMSEEAFRKSLADIRSTFAASRDRLGAPTGSAQANGANTPATSTPAASAIPTITSKAQADALPAGSVFIGPDGKQYRK